MNEVRTDKGLLVYKINDEAFSKILRGNAGRWTEKEFKAGKQTVYVITDECVALTAGHETIKLFLWEGFYIQPCK